MLTQPRCRRSPGRTRAGERWRRRGPGSSCPTPEQGGSCWLLRTFSPRKPSRWQPHLLHCTREKKVSRRQTRQVGLEFLHKQEQNTYLGPSCSSLKICTVSVLLEAQRNWPSGLKDKDLILTYLHTNKPGLRSEVEGNLFWFRGQYNHNIITYK